MTPQNTIRKIYRLLAAEYGYQGWWPLGTRASTPGYGTDGYRLAPDETGKPLSPNELLEIASGAILTQNTAWRNAHRALESLRKRGFLDGDALQRAQAEPLSQVIHSSGYHNQKAKKLIGVAAYLKRIEDEAAVSGDRRTELLSIWGIGPETADSILLYGFGEPHFIVDVYALRIFERVGIIGPKAGYREVQSLIHDSLPADVELFGEYHALLVRHGQEYCRKRPQCERCPLRAACAYARNG